MLKFLKVLQRLQRFQCPSLSFSVRNCSGYSLRLLCNRVYSFGSSAYLSTRASKNETDPGEEAEQLLSDLDSLSMEQRKSAFALASKSAELGSSKGKLLLGCLLRCGIGTERNEKKALEVLEPLAKAGDSYASFLCGDILEQFYEETLSAGPSLQEVSHIGNLKNALNKDTSENEEILENAIRYYEKSVEDGNDESLIALGNAWLKMQHPEMAKEAYMEAAKKGLASSFLCLGNLYFRGYVGKFSSVNRDAMKASKYLTAAAEEGSIEAKYLLGELYASGMEPIEPDEASAISYLESAAEHNHSDACYLLAKILLEKEELDPGSVDMEKLFKYLLIAAEQNHAGACYFLADLYFKAGSGTSTNGVENYQQALTLFERSGSSGLPEGYYMAGLMYLHGVGTQMNAKIGVALLNQAAEMGFVGALEKLSELYRFGEFGLEKSEQKAELLQKTASSLKEKSRKITEYMQTSPLSSKRVSSNKGIFPKPRSEEHSKSSKFPKE